MPHVPPDAPRTRLEELDVALAAWALAEWTAAQGGQDSPPPALLQGEPFPGWRWSPSDELRRRWVTGLLDLRGMGIDRRDVDAVFDGRPCRFQAQHQEHQLIVGARAVLTSIEARGAEGELPDGWTLVAAFRTLTRNVRRFHNNALRKDQPWDAVRGIGYPPASQLGSLLDAFHPAHSFGDDPRTFDALHPVRQALRIGWQLARIAPFPDFNLPMAAVATSAALLARGYPLLVVGAQDRDQLAALVASRRPTRVGWAEGRLLEAVEAGRSVRQA